LRGPGAEPLAGCGAEPHGLPRKKASEEAFFLKEKVFKGDCLRTENKNLVQASSRVKRWGSFHNNYNNTFSYSCLALCPPNFSPECINILCNLYIYIFPLCKNCPIFCNFSPFSPNSPVFLPATLVVWLSNRLWCNSVF